MENVVGRSVHLTPSGIDFDEHVFQLGQGTVVRAAGSLIFPRYPFACFSPVQFALIMCLSQTQCASDIHGRNTMRNLQNSCGSRQVVMQRLPPCFMCNCRILQSSSELDSCPAGSCQSRRERSL